MDRFKEDNDELLEKDVYHVLSGQATGWAVMAEKVREVDEEKVKDAKEDIDTLLVFVRDTICTT